MCARLQNRDEKIQGFTTAPLTYASSHEVEGFHQCVICLQAHRRLHDFKNSDEKNTRLHNCSADLCQWSWAGRIASSLQGLINVARKVQGHTTALQTYTKDHGLEGLHLGAVCLLAYRCLQGSITVAKAIQLLCRLIPRIMGWRDFADSVICFQVYGYLHAFETVVEKYEDTQLLCRVIPVIMR